MCTCAGKNNTTLFQKHMSYWCYLFSFNWKIPDLCVIVVTPPWSFFQTINKDTDISCYKTGKAGVRINARKLQ